MAIVNSLLFGSEGSYKILGVDVNFGETPPAYFPFPKASSNIRFVVSRPLSLISQYYTHVLVHEMGHAMAARFFGANIEIIKIFSNNRGGVTEHNGGLLQPYKKTIITLAGPMTSMIFSSMKLAAIVGLKAYLAWPVAAVLGGGTLLVIHGELIYALTSTCTGFGDFGDISQNGYLHLSICSVLLLTQYASGMYIGSKLPGALLVSFCGICLHTAIEKLSL